MDEPVAMKFTYEDEDIPHKWIEVMLHFLTGLRNDTRDYSKPHLRPSIVRIYPVFIVLYSIVIVCGTIGNIGIIYSVFRDKLYRDQTCVYLINLALANLVKCIIVLPISLTVLLVQNWIFGSFLCYFLPMIQVRADPYAVFQNIKFYSLQYLNFDDGLAYTEIILHQSDIPCHVTMLTFVLIALDRHRFLQDPIKPRIPAFVCATGSWLMAICIVLPYPIYTTYIDLEKYMNSQFKGVGICAVNLADDMQEYVRGLFIAMYVLPLAVTAYLYVKMSRELEDQDGPLAFMLYEARSQRNSHSHHHYREGGHCENNFRYQSPTVNFDLYEAELDMRREKRTQKYLISMVTIFAICLCPLTVLRLAKLALTETYENSGHFDITFTMFVWMAFLPTCTTPALYASWRMSRSTKERLKGYFRLSNRHMRRSCEPPVESAVPVGSVSSRANRESISNTSQQSSRFGGTSTPNTSLYLHSS